MSISSDITLNKENVSLLLEWIEESDNQALSDAICSLIRAKDARLEKLKEEILFLNSIKP